MSEPVLLDLAAVEHAVTRAVRDAVRPFADFSGPYLTAQQAADYLGVSLRLFEQLVSGGDIRPVRITKRARRFERAALDAFARSRVR